MKPETVFHDVTSHDFGIDTVVRTRTATSGDFFSYTETDTYQRQSYKHRDEFEATDGGETFSFWSGKDLDDRDESESATVNIPREVVFAFHAWMTECLYGVDNPNEAE